MQNIAVDSSYLQKDEMIAFMQAQYWNSEYDSNKVGVIGENYLKKY